jgi:hypothetical protein
MTSSLLYPDSVGKVQKIFRFYAVFYRSASDCTKLRLELENGHCLSDSPFLAKTEALPLKRQFGVGIQDADDQHKMSATLR